MNDLFSAHYKKGSIHILAAGILCGKANPNKTYTFGKKPIDLSWLENTPHVCSQCKRKALPLVAPERYVNKSNWHGMPDYALNNMLFVEREFYKDVTGRHGMFIYCETHYVIRDGVVKQIGYSVSNDHYQEYVSGDSIMDVRKDCDFLGVFDKSLLPAEKIFLEFYAPTLKKRLLAQKKIYT